MNTPPNTGDATAFRKEDDGIHLYCEKHGQNCIESYQDKNGALNVFCKKCKLDNEFKMSNTGDAELDLNDKLTYEIYHLVGAVANECHYASLFTPEEEAERALLPNFDPAVKEIMQLIAAHDRALIKTILAEDIKPLVNDMKSFEGISDDGGIDISIFSVKGSNETLETIIAALQKRLEQNNGPKRCYNIDST